MAIKINKSDDINPQSQNSSSSVSNDALPQSPSKNLDVSTDAVDISADIPQVDILKQDDYISDNLVESDSGSLDKPNNGTVEISYDNELNLSEKEINSPITDDTVLSFEFENVENVEIQSIGLDNHTFNGTDGGSLFLVYDGQSRRVEELDDHIVGESGDIDIYGIPVDDSQSSGIEELDDYILGFNDGLTQDSINKGEFFTDELDLLTSSYDYDVTN